MLKPKLAKYDKEWIVFCYLFFSPENLDAAFYDIRVCVNSSCGDKQLNISASLCNLSYDLDLK